MPKGGPGLPRSVPRQCKICNHEGAAEIDLMLANGARYKDIIARMRAAHPGSEELTEPNLSRHKTAHLLTRPMKTTEVDAETGQLKEAYIIGHLTQAITVPRDAIPKPADVISIPDALGVIINAGVRNVATNPEWVTPQILMFALDMARKMGIGGKEVEEFAEAWRALTKEKNSRRRKTTVMVEETIEGPATQRGETIDAETVTPAEWSEDELRLLDAPEKEEKEEGRI